MPRPKKPITKMDKKLKNEFEQAMEPPASAATVDIPSPRPSRPDPVEDTFIDGSEIEKYAPSIDRVPRAAGETPETAIKPGGWHTPNAKTPITPETPPTVIVPESEPVTEIKGLGYRIIPDQALSIDAPLELPQDAPESLGGGLVDKVPEDAAKRLRLAVEAIDWLSNQVRNMPPKTKEIIRLRKEGLINLIQYFK